MRGRLDIVNVAYSRGTVELPWASRDALLNQIKHLDSAKDVTDAFVAVGATRPVELSNDDAGLLLGVINHWASQTPGGYAGLPDGVWDLRNAVVDHLHDRAGGP